MIEKIVLDYLNDNLTVDAFMEKPEDPPEKFVVIEKTGSGRDNLIDTATFALRSYAPELHEAAELNEEVKAAMDGLISLDAVGKSKLNSDYNFTDAGEKQYRYQAVYNITYH